jgi:hypothetical protein
MRKKKVIVAFVVFLVIACGVLVFVNRNCYSSKAVLTEVCKKCTYADQFTPLGGAIHPSALTKVISWYKYNFSSYHYNYKAIDPHKPITIFYGNNIVVVKLSSKLGLVSSVEIRGSDSSQSVLDLKSRLSDRFPGLPCKIVSFP